jgi:hypothetical protein
MCARQARAAVPASSSISAQMPWQRETAVPTVLKRPRS